MSVTWEKWVDAWRQGTNTNDSSHIEAVITGVVRQSLTRLKVPRSYKPMKRRFGTTP